MSAIFTVVDTEWNNAGDMHDIAWTEVMGNGDIATHIQRILIQPRNVSCGRRFGPDITVEDLLSAPTFEKCHPRIQTVLCKKCATIVSWGLACDQSVLQNNASSRNSADIVYGEGMCAQSLARRLVQAGSIVCSDCTQENICASLGFDFGASDHEAAADASCCAAAWCEMLRFARINHNVNVRPARSKRPASELSSAASPYCQVEMDADDADDCEAEHRMQTTSTQRLTANLCWAHGMQTTATQRLTAKQCWAHGVQTTATQRMLKLSGWHVLPSHTNASVIRTNRGHVSNACYKHLMDGCWE
jgi:hypothetical protein